MCEFLAKLERIGSIHGLSHASILIGKQSHRQCIPAQHQGKQHIKRRQQCPPKPPTCDEGIYLVFVWVTWNRQESIYAIGFKSSHHRQPKYQGVVDKNSKIKIRSITSKSKLTICICLVPWWNRSHGRYLNLELEHSSQSSLWIGPGHRMFSCQTWIGLWHRSDLLAEVHRQNRCWRHTSFSFYLLRNDFQQSNYAQKAQSYHVLCYCGRWNHFHFHFEFAIWKA